MTPELYIDLGKTECFPTIGANGTDDNERVILTFNVYPASSIMSVSLEAAVELANKIYWIADQKKKEAA